MADKKYTLTITASVTVPEQAKEIHAFDGTVVGFELPEGTLIKPWTVWEQQDSAESDGKDLKHEELTALGFDIDYETRVLEEEL